MGKAVHPLTVGQKLALRNWYFNQKQKPSQTACAAWLKLEYNVSVSQSLISKTLNSKALEALDCSKDPGMRSYRISHAEWPVLERILRNWQLEMEKYSQPTTREDLQFQARWIWQNVPEARNNLDDPQNPPLFGRKWHTNFQKRWSIKN